MLYVPGPMLYAAIIAAGAFTKVGRSKLTTRDTSLVPAGLWIEEIACALNTDQWEVDSRSVVIPATGGRIMCHRPRLDQWATSFTLLIDGEMFSDKLARQLVDDAGKKIGIGDYRPARKGPFGRFVVKRWHELEDQGVAA